MRKRLFSFLLALCYLSVSLGFSSSHFHNHEKGMAHQCVACSWQIESVSDVPASPLLLIAPVILVKPEVLAEVRLVTGGPLLLSDRGPPFVS